jgi:hypothetical protein
MFNTDNCKLNLLFMKKFKSKLMLLSACAMILSFALPIVADAADCMQADSIGCFDRFGTYYPKDIKGLPDCCPGVE